MVPSSGIVEVVSRSFNAVVLKSLEKKIIVLNVYYSWDIVYSMANGWIAGNHYGKAGSLS